LFNDTYTEYNNPQIGLSAVRILNYLGYEVIVPPHQCCGRPAYSKGVLEYAKSQAEKLVERLKPYSHLPILVLEPSCFSALTDELNDLHLSLPSFDFRYFDDFIAEHAKNGNLPLPFLPFKRKVWVHGHCHQKALIGMQGTLRALKACPNLTVEEIHSGCCGMAGSFGYETEHVEFSKKIGELKLLPAVRSAKQEDLISANGFSCRTQIEDGANRKSLHTAEIIASLIA
jgi:Fe-S oxidoreductase